MLNSLQLYENYIHCTMHKCTIVHSCTVFLIESMQLRIHVFWHKSTRNTGTSRIEFCSHAGQHSAGDRKPANWARFTTRCAIVACDEMTTRQEHSIDRMIHTDLASPVVFQSSIHFF